MRSRLSGAILIRAHAEAASRSFECEGEARLERRAVKLTQLPGMQVQNVAKALDVRPFMRSRWRSFKSCSDYGDVVQAMFGSSRSAVRATNQQLIGKNRQLMSFSGNSATTSPPCLACL